MVAKKHKLAAQNNSLISVGTWKNTPHYAVVGMPTDLYLFHSTAPGTGQNTKWIQGSEAFELHAKLKQARMRSKEEFVKLFMTEFDSRPKS